MDYHSPKQHRTVTDYPCAMASALSEFETLGNKPNTLRVHTNEETTMLVETTLGDLRALTVRCSTREGHLILSVG